MIKRYTLYQDMRSEDLVGGVTITVMTNDNHKESEELLGAVDKVLRGLTLVGKNNQKIFHLMLELLDDCARTPSSLPVKLP